MDSTLARSQALEAVRSLAKKWGEAALVLEAGSRVVVSNSHMVDGELKGVEAVVQTADEDFQVRYAGLRRGWTADCSCGANDGCAHTLLGLCAALQLSVGDFGPFSGKSVGGSTAKVSQARRAQSDSLETVVSAKVGRGLSREEVGFLSRVEVMYSKFSTYGKIPVDVLEPFLGARRLSGSEGFEIWPSKPKSGWEAWLYLFVFLKSRGGVVPAFLASITTAAEMASLEEGWEGRQLIRQWEDQLDRLLTELESSQVRVCLEVRMVMSVQSARIECQRLGEEEWSTVGEREVEELARLLAESRIDCTSGSRGLMEAFFAASMGHSEITFSRAENREKLARMLLAPMFRDLIVSIEGDAYQWPEETLRWILNPADDDSGDYLLELVLPDNRAPHPPLFSVGGNLNCYVTSGSVYRTSPMLRLDPRQPLRIPAQGLRSGKAVRFLQGLGVPLPGDLADRVVVVEPKIRMKCWLETRGGEERLSVRVTCDLGEHGVRTLTSEGWEGDEGFGASQSDVIVSVDERQLRVIPSVLHSISAKDFRGDDEVWGRVVGKRFPDEFVPWLESVPKGVEVELEGDLESLRSAVVKGSVRLEMTETSPDWFDLHVALSVSDTELTPEEIQLLLEGKGKFVRLKGKGWRRLEFDMDDEEAAHFAELGLNPADLDGPPQRFHALQLASSSASRLMEKEVREKIRRRAEELQVQVKPEVPDSVKVELRPYQHAGFHFLAYLSTNHFGGILADDMGLGKTLQTLTWIMWLRSQPDFSGGAVLVVCPKSVVQNWLLESERFTPDLRASTWRGGDGASLKRMVDRNDLIVVNYAQLRLSSAALTAQRWHAIVLDEAQYIKNPASQTAVTACSLQGKHRLALSGTPIENRLLDLWSIMQFAMPGLLGARAQFQRIYDSRTDLLARRKLSSRVRPFVLRRNKSEVAKDLPARIEEDLVVEMEGTQALLYRAELKKARQSLLKIGGSKELDKQRFNVLTSLLRLRQICCHPGLVSEEHGYADSAKMEALTDLLEPLMEEGHKVLVFSQFVEMLERVEREMDARGWDSFVLTGETEDRGELVADFQKHEGSAVFLISLRAGGMGLNLTAASYVVLFDPWWNPAVENQAIDRTHRIGQTQQVIAYRLVAKDSIEQKIRQLQRSKSAMAGDILGEESFARALTLDDFHFLMED